MKREILFVLVLIGFVGSAFSQENATALKLGDFSGKLWTKEKINRSITWYELKDSLLFGEPQSINVVKVDLKKHKYNVDLVYSDSVRVLLSEMAEQQDALAAINGTFFDMKKGGAVVFFKVDDDIITPPNSDAPKIIREAAFAVGDSVRISAFPKDNWENWHTDFEDIMVSGPILINHSKRIEPDSVSFNLTKHPRSAIGITDNYELLLVTADGRHKNKANGLSMKELGILMEALHCKDAMNLDGGGSTTLWLSSKGVVNYPSDNKLFDHNGARTIANGITISKN